jgi:uroporphyrinogen decarboxylase
MFSPNYQNQVSACRNIEVQRTPLYEHIIAPEVMEKILNRKFADLINGDDAGKKDHFTHYCRFFYEMGYDTVSYECCIGPAMPGSGALGGHVPGVIKTRADFDSYPWDDIPRLFFEKYAKNFEIMGSCLPPGMKAVGGPGNGVSSSCGASGIYMPYPGSATTLGTRVPPCCRLTTSGRISYRSTSTSYR